MTGDRAEHSCSKHTEEKKNQTKSQQTKSNFGFLVRGEKQSPWEKKHLRAVGSYSCHTLADKKSDKSATKSGLVGRYLTLLDLKTSCWALSASVR